MQYNLIPFKLGLISLLIGQVLRDCKFVFESYGSSGPKSGSFDNFQQAWGGGGIPFLVEPGGRMGDQTPLKRFVVPKCIESIRNRSIKASLYDPLQGHPFNVPK